jgi:hypothetical protein
VDVALIVLLVIAIGVISYLTVQLRRAGRLPPANPQGAVPGRPSPPPHAISIPNAPDKTGRPPVLISVPQLVGTPGGLPPVEPTGLPRGPDVVPDSAVDGANLGSITVRAASIRGDHHRQEPNFRQETYTIQPLTDKFDVPNLVSVVATGNPNSSVAQDCAALACRSVVTQLSKLSGGINAAWNGQPGTEQLQELLHPVYNAVASRLVELAESRQVPEAESAVKLICLVSQLGDTSQRRHLAFGIGGGGIFRCTDQGCESIFSAHEESLGKPAALPARHQEFRVSMVQSQKGEILLVTSPATMQVITNSDSGTFFAQQWRNGPRDLVEFLWQFSARTPETAKDRTVVCLWDFGRTLPQAHSERFISGPY